MAMLNNQRVSINAKQIGSISLPPRAGLGILLGRMEKVQVATGRPETDVGMPCKPTLVPLVAIDQQMPGDQWENHFAGSPHDLRGVIPDEARDIGGIEIYSAVV